MKPSNRHTAAVSLIVRKAIGDPLTLASTEHTLLCVWNRRYEGWTLPGGKVEERESIAQAQRRELEEETGLLTQEAELVYAAPLLPPLIKHRDRAARVHVFRVTPRPGQEPRACEDGSPVDWKTLDEFLDACPFADFYRRMVAAGVEITPL